MSLARNCVLPCILFALEEEKPPQKNVFEVINKRHIPSSLGTSNLNPSYRIHLLKHVFDIIHVEKLMAQSKTQVHNYYFFFISLISAYSDSQKYIHMYSTHVTTIIFLFF